MRKREEISPSRQKDEGLLVVLGGFECGGKEFYLRPENYQNFTSDRMKATDCEELPQTYCHFQR